jgi:hypothetical protein
MKAQSLSNLLWYIKGVSGATALPAKMAQIAGIGVLSLFCQIGRAA